MRTCDACGYQNSANAKKCVCGNALVQEKNKMKKSKSDIVIILSIFGSIVLLISALVVLYSKNTHDEERRNLLKEKVEAFDKGEYLLCDGEIVSTKNGWQWSGRALIKQDRFYILDNCFVEHK